MLPVYHGINYSYSYETNTGHYLLYDNEYKSHAYLQGDDARIFREQVEIIDNLPETAFKNRSPMDDIISDYL
jgi:hypothetical protein